MIFLRRTHVLLEFSLLDTGASDESDEEEQEYEATVLEPMGGDSFGAASSSGFDHDEQRIVSMMEGGDSAQEDELPALPDTRFFFHFDEPIEDGAETRLPEEERAFWRTQPMYAVFLHVCRANWTRFREEITQGWEQGRGDLTQEFKRKHKSATRRKERQGRPATRPHAPADK